MTAGDVRGSLKARGTEEARRGLWSIGVVNVKGSDSWSGPGAAEA